MSWLFKSNHPDPKSSNLHDYTIIHSSSPPQAVADCHCIKDDNAESKEPFSQNALMMVLLWNGEYAEAQ
ncbi:hypothetical protein JHK82_018860 [Glycine max]|nr:hypothetical protein JHK85_019303 [Glycine max]KAG5038041.1 hypothetical protein JHK86_018881 [Glycine max]KAG5143165.1 hypothetical protein JHK82_018860 [Glycine max]